MVFQGLLAIVSFFSGIVASVAGFGIGSFVTPVLTLSMATGLAIAVVSVIHFFGTLLRFFMWRKHINKKVLISFGITSAIGGLTGALLHNYLFSSALTVVFGCLLLLTGVMGYFDLAKKIQFKGVMAWVAGAISGLFGGLVGNQGGVRSAALFGFELTSKEFVATATGIALITDIVRMPVYFSLNAKEIFSLWPIILLASVCVMLGTLLGGKLLKRIPEQHFKKVISVMIFCIGIFVFSTI